MRVMFRENLTPDALAEKAEVASSTIQNWLKSRTDGSPWLADQESIKSVAKALCIASFLELCYSPDEVAKIVPVESISLYSRSLTPSPITGVLLAGLWKFDFEQTFANGEPVMHPDETLWRLALTVRIHQRDCFVAIDHQDEYVGQLFRLKFKGQIVEAGSFFAGPYEFSSNSPPRFEWGYVMTAYFSDRLEGTFMARNCLHGFTVIGGKFKATRVKS